MGDTAFLMGLSAGFIADLPQEVPPPLDVTCVFDGIWGKSAAARNHATALKDFPQAVAELSLFMIPVASSGSRRAAFE
jgi:hypothetical protein